MASKLGLTIHDSVTQLEDWYLEKKYDDVVNLAILPR